MEYLKFPGTKDGNCPPMACSSSNGDRNVPEIFGKNRVTSFVDITNEVESQQIPNKGDSVRADGEVLKARALKTRRTPNVTCRVENFGKVCATFDGRRIAWVEEMGFGGLLNLVDMQLPLLLCYWLMTRIDHVNRMFCSPDGHNYRLHSYQVKWVLGIPCCGQPVPSKLYNEDTAKFVRELEEKYSFVKEKVARSSGRVTRRNGIQVSEAMLNWLEGQWQEEDEREFKLLFLITALELVLCPTQTERLSKDLIPALQCANDACQFDWGSLVIDKLMTAAKRFSKRFETEGYAGGGGGCTIFLAIFYLDRLARDPLSWGQHPRIGVWSSEEIRKAINADRGGQDIQGDFGHTRMIDVAYGERHPNEPRDICVPLCMEAVNKMKTLDVLKRKRKSKSQPHSVSGDPRSSGNTTVELQLNSHSMDARSRNFYLFL